MNISNRFTQYAAGAFFLLACSCGQLNFEPQKSNTDLQPAGLKVIAGTTNETPKKGCQVRKISLEISLFTNQY
ncbi:hypothetical protein [Pedobacter nyackensis]|uniref:hypothetical protein n=1 Tax=Pedobacter nyackensis TaxID=475255 RepID=UPI0029319CEE|nr:hypothetical protein [Pedobacter nyackensis]